MEIKLQYCTSIFEEKKSQIYCTFSPPYLNQMSGNCYEREYKPESNPLWSTVLQSQDTNYLSVALSFRHYRDR
jgi:hypothetical protein